MLVKDLQTELALALRDVGMEQVTAVQLLRFINRAARDAGNSDWVDKAAEDDTTILAASTYYYNVPAGFTYINQLRLESTAPLFPTRIPDSQWKLVFRTAAQIYFEPRLFTITVGKKVKVVGRKRPTLYVSSADTVDIGLESFLHERATLYGARFLARRGGEHTSFYDTLAQTAWATSSQLLQYEKGFFRVSPGDRPVPRA